jgi:hypothetical protein
MAYFEYKVVPFIGKIRASGSPAEVGQQLQAAISGQAHDGWEFYQLADVNIQVAPGCLAGLFGGQDSYVRFDQLIFRRQME